MNDLVGVYLLLASFIGMIAMIWLVVVTWRLMQAHESIAESLSRLVQQPGDEDPDRHA